MYFIFNSTFTECKYKKGLSSRAKNLDTFNPVFALCDTWKEVKTVNYVDFLSPTPFEVKIFILIVLHFFFLSVTRGISFNSSSDLLWVVSKGDTKLSAARMRDSAWTCMCACVRACVSLCVCECIKEEKKVREMKRRLEKVRYRDYERKWDKEREKW